MTANVSINTVNELNSKGIERLTSLGEINLRYLESVTTRQVDAFNLYLEHGVRLLKLATESKGYNDFFKGQVEATKDLSEHVAAESKTYLQLAGEARDDYRAWFEKSLAEVSADLRKGAAA
jgi:hypothetical protein